MFNPVSGISNVHKVPVVEKRVHKMYSTFKAWVKRTGSTLFFLGVIVFFISMFFTMLNHAYKNDLRDANKHEEARQAKAAEHYKLCLAAQSKESCRLKIYETYNILFE